MIEVGSADQLISALTVSKQGVKKGQLDGQFNPAADLAKERFKR